MELKASERFALNQWLCDYPQDKTFKEVIDAIMDQDDDNDEGIVVWDVIETYSRSQIIDIICDTEEAFRRAVRDAVEEW